MSGATTIKPAGSYDVAKPLGQCAVTGEPIAAGEKFMTGLLETPEGLNRIDVAMANWGRVDHDRMIAYWQSVMPHRDQPRKVFVDDEVLGTLFERLADVTEPSKLSFRFVLGLILMRKRLLSYEGSLIEEGQEIWLMRAKSKPEPMRLLNPKLDEQQVAQVSQQMGEILNQEL